MLKSIQQGIWVLWRIECEIFVCFLQEQVGREGRIKFHRRWCQLTNWWAVQFWEKVPYSSFIDMRFFWGNHQKNHVCGYILGWVSYNSFWNLLIKRLEQSAFSTILAPFQMNADSVWVLYLAKLKFSFNSYATILRWLTSCSWNILVSGFLCSYNVWLWVSVKHENFWRFRIWS